MADAVSSVGKVIDADQRALLSAAAAGGSAGVAAFKEAQSALGAERAAAAGRAASLSALMGGPEAQGVGQISDQYYGRGIANLASAQGTFSADMARRTQAFNDYLSKAKAAIPAYQAETARVVGLKRAAAEAKAAKEAAEEAKKLPKASDILNLTENITSLYPDSTLAGTVGPNGRTTTGSASIPAGRTMVTDQMMMVAADRAAFNKTTTEFELAKIVAESQGLNPTQIAKLITPSSSAAATTKATKATTPPATPDEKWLIGNVRGMDSTKAKQALQAPEFKEAGRQSTEYFAVAPLDEDGKINDGSAYDGMTPKEAFRTYVYSQAGNRTMKDAAFKYYGATLRG